jgi:hypothetical protein
MITPDERKMYHQMLDRYLDEREHSFRPDEMKLVQSAIAGMEWDGPNVRIRTTRHLMLVRIEKLEEVR